MHVEFHGLGADIEQLIKMVTNLSYWQADEIALSGCSQLLVVQVLEKMQRRTVPKLDAGTSGHHLQPSTDHLYHVGKCCTIKKVKSKKLIS